MWTVLAFISALCLGFYDVSKKIALKENAVIDVLTMSVCVSAVLLAVPLVLSSVAPETMIGTHFYVPRMDLQAHGLTLLKSVIVLSSWVFGYISLKHLPISVVSPAQATRPMWTLLGALVLFNERLNTWQWVGILLAIGTILAFSFKPSGFRNQESGFRINQKYYIALALAILLGACSGLYDKYLMRQYDHNAVQVYYTMYQAVLMLVVWSVFRIQESEFRNQESVRRPIVKKGVICLISLFLIISDKHSSILCN